MTTPLPCPACGTTMVMEHQHDRCPGCGVIYPCCDGAPGPGEHTTMPEVLVKIWHDRARRDYCDKCVVIPDAELHEKLCRDCFEVYVREAKRSGEMHW